jgi:hypothetical protein
MADKTYKDHAEGVRGWMSETADAELTDPGSRKWCILELTSLTPSEVGTYFSSAKPNQDFKDEVDKDQVTGIPVAQHQIESDQLYSLAKCMAYRHQPRLRHYRDDIENKDIRTRTSIAFALAKMNLLTDSMKNST